MQDGEYPIHRASRGGHVECVRALTEAGAAANVKNMARANPPPRWKKRYSSDVPRKNKGSLRPPSPRASAAPAPPQCGWTPLHCAALKGSEPCMRALLEAGATVDAINRWGDTPLMVAARNGRADCVRLLLGSGSDRDAESNVRRPPSLPPGALRWSTPAEPSPLTWRRPAPPRLRTAARPSTSRRTSSSATPSPSGARPRCAAARPPASHTSRLPSQPRLTTKPTSTQPTAQAIEQRSLFEHALGGNDRRLRDLLKRGVEQSHRDGRGLSPLHAAALGGHAECARLLLAAGADFDDEDPAGLTPLHFAAERGHEAVAELLVEAGADPEAEDSEGTTPVHLAANGGHLELVKLLIAAAE